MNRKKINQKSFKNGQQFALSFHISTAKFWKMKIFAEKLCSWMPKLRPRPFSGFSLTAYYTSFTISLGDFIIHSLKLNSKYYHTLWSVSRPSLHYPNHRFYCYYYCLTISQAFLQYYELHFTQKGSIM